MQVLEHFQNTSRAFFQRDVLEVAPELLGALLIRHDEAGTVGLRLTEVEAYAGERDPGAHGYRGKTKRNQSMFGEAGHIYCYFTYGLHHALNLVCGQIGEGYGCLIRAGEVIIGQELARARRESQPRKHPILEWGLARGPGNVAQAFGADLRLDGDDLFEHSENPDAYWQFLLPLNPVQHTRFTGARIGVNGEGGDPEKFPWRFWLADEPSVSAHRVPKNHPKT